MDVGQRFLVLRERQFKEGDAVMANYLPGYTYRVTDRNKAFVEGMVTEGAAQLDEEPTSGGLRVVASLAEAAGSVTVGKK